MGAHLDEDESIELAAQLDRFFASPQKPRQLNGSKMVGDCHAAHSHKLCRIRVTHESLNGRDKFQGTLTPKVR